MTAAVVADPRVAGAVLGRAFTAFALGATRKPSAQVLVTADRTAASIWLPPGQWRAPMSELVRQPPGCYVPTARD